MPVRRGMTKAQEIAADLRRQIESGDLAAGAVLPSESKLMSQYNYSRETVRAGVRALVEEGLVVTGWGQGKYVREAYPPVVWNWTTLESRSRHENAVEGQTAGDQWASAVTQEGKAPRQEISVSIVEPPTHVRDALAMPDGGLAVARKRVRYVDNRPYALADSYFPQELVTGTLLMEPRDVAAPGGVLASVGLIQVKYRDEIAVRMP
ncbi:GntR family transcriptional regulator, partial [Streptomyces sp. JAC25]|uniref:GntR family transcriptional regulator n=1 Tax=Streptomyces sp. JAC25 TaxID=3418413 RepID=UPI003D814A29